MVGSNLFFGIRSAGSNVVEYDIKYCGKRHNLNHYLFVSDKSLRQGMDPYTEWLEARIEAQSLNGAYCVDQKAVQGKCDIITC